MQLAIINLTTKPGTTKLSANTSCANSQVASFLDEHTAKNFYPPDLQSIIDAEQRRAAELTANIEARRATITVVKSDLSLLATGTQKCFIDS